MIREHSTARLRKDARLRFVCDFDEDIVGDLDDPSCVRTIEIFEPAKPYDEWERIDCFVADLDEVVEAEGRDREDICSDFEFMLIENHWTEDTPPERYHTIWIVQEGDTAKAWLRRGFKSSFELIRNRANTPWGGEIFAYGGWDNTERSRAEIEEMVNSWKRRKDNPMGYMEEIWEEWERDFGYPHPGRISGAASE